MAVVTVNRQCRFVLAFAALTIDMRLSKKKITTQDVIAVGIGVAAPVEYTRRQRDLGLLRGEFGMPAWNGINPAAELKKMLRWETPFVLENDANLVALAEKRRGAAREIECAVVVKWTQGIGAGLIAGRDLLRGAPARQQALHRGLELGHVLLTPAAFSGTRTQAVTCSLCTSSAPGSLHHRLHASSLQIDRHGRRPGALRQANLMGVLEAHPGRRDPFDQRRACRTPVPRDRARHTGGDQASRNMSPAVCSADPGVGDLSSTAVAYPPVTERRHSAGGWRFVTASRRAGRIMFTW
jgi:hypothetical protein